MALAHIRMSFFYVLRQTIMMRRDVDSVGAVFARDFFRPRAGSETMGYVISDVLSVDYSI